MVKKVENKSAKKNTQNSKSSNILLPKSQLQLNQRITRLKSLQTETEQKEKKNSVQNCFTVNTRSKCKARTLPYATRNKSKKIEKIVINNDSNKQQLQNSDDKLKKQTKSLSVSKTQFIKLNNFKVNSLVLAKQKYSYPWPARVLEIHSEKVKVFFFGDKRCEFVPINEIYDFILSMNATKATIASKKKQKTYLTGIAEIELLFGIAREDSLLN